MFSKNLLVFDFLASSETDSGNNKVTTLVTWGLVFILLLTVISLAFMQCAELFEYDDLFSTESNSAAGAISSLIIISSSAFDLRIFAMILFFEYLRSHIGEKLFAGWMSKLGISSLFAFFKTALYGAVFFGVYPLALDAAQRLFKVFALIANRINFVQENF